MRVLKVLFGKGVAGIPVSGEGIELNIKGYDKKMYPWSSFHRITFVESMEEYSGYTFTKEYTDNTHYDKIIMDTPNNVVKIRTTGKTKELVGEKNPFVFEFGTAYLYHTAFFEMNIDGVSILYGISVKKTKFHHTYKEMKRHAQKDVEINSYKNLAGFASFSQLELF